jgi:hypothetical protein
MFVGLVVGFEGVGLSVVGGTRRDFERLGFRLWLLFCLHWLVARPHS